MESSLLAFSRALVFFAFGFAVCDLGALVIFGFKSLDGARGVNARTSRKKLLDWPTARERRTGSSTRTGAAGTFHLGTSDTIKAISARQSRRQRAGIRASPPRHKRMSSPNSSCMRTRDFAASSL